MGLSTLKEIAELTGASIEELQAIAALEASKRRQNEFLLTEPWPFYKDLVCPPDKQSYLRPFHKEGLEWLNRKGGKRFKLVLWPRGHLKSSIFTQGESVRLALNNPNIRILINSSTVDPIGRSFLKAIKGHFTDERIVSRYGELLPHSKSGKMYKNNEDELVLLSRTNLTLKEPSITVSGLDRTKTSQHYDFIWHDDIVVRENVGTFEQMDKVYRVWQDSLDLLEPDGTMVVIGTRWHPLDLYGRIISDYVDPRCFDGVCTSHVRGCKCFFDVSILMLRDDKGAYIFDSKFDDDIAGQLLSIKGRREFASQYENNPSSPDAVWFSQKSLDDSLYEDAEIDAIRDKLTWIMICDPAESTESRSSYTAVVCVGVDFETGDLYADFAKQARVDTEGFISLIFGSHFQCNPHRFAMEKTTRKALEYVIKDKMAQYNRFFSIEEVKPDLGRRPNAKETRIRRLAPLLEAGRLHINKKLRDLLSILYTIPASPTWDLADALSYVLQLIPGGLGTGGPRPKRPPRVLQNKGLQYVTRRVGRSQPDGEGVEPIPGPRSGIKFRRGNCFRSVCGTSRLR